MRTPFSLFVIQLQTWTATTGGIAQTRTRPAVRSSRTQVETRTSSSAISVPSTIVRPTFTAVKTTVRSSVCQKTASWRTLRKLSSPTYSPWCASEREQVVLLRARAGRGSRAGSRGSPRARRDGEDQQVRAPTSRRRGVRSGAAAASPVAVAAAARAWGRSRSGATYELVEGLCDVRAPRAARPVSRSAVR